MLTILKVNYSGSSSKKRWQYHRRQFCAYTFVEKNKPPKSYRNREAYDNVFPWNITYTLVLVQVAEAIHKFK